MSLSLSHMRATIMYNGKKLMYYVFSERLPPLIVLRNSFTDKIARILLEKYGYHEDNETKIIRIPSFESPAVLVWLFTCITAKPTKELLNALLNYTPRSALDLVFEVIDTRHGYKRGRPLIPPRYARAASKIVSRILALHGYPVEKR